MKKATIILYTGNGAGKTSASLGVCLRACGHGKRAVVIQFLKGRKNIGEYKIMEKLKPNFEIYQFGSPDFIDLKNPSTKDCNLAQNGILCIKEKLLKNPPDVLVLDEINIAASIGLINPKEVLELINLFPAKTTIFLTGRNAPIEFIEKADTVTEMQKIKHIFDKGVMAKKGIQF